MTRTRNLSLIGAIAAFAVAAAAPAALPVGASAPDFETRGALAGKVFTLKLSNELKKGPVVLYFFPAAFTPGCTAEAHEFAEATDDFKKAGATVIAPTGRPFTNASIGSAIATRAIMADLRANGDAVGGPAPFSKTDRSRFLSALDLAVGKLVRAG